MNFRQVLFPTLSLLVLFSPLAAEEQKARKTDFKSRITVSKETTVITGPLKKDGSVDYVGALNKIASKGVTTDNNVVVKLLEFIGPTGPEQSAEWAKNAAKMLGMQGIPQEGPFFVKLATVYRQRNPELTDTEFGQNINDVLDSMTAAMQGPWKTEDRPEIAAWIEANRESAKVLEEGIVREKFYMPYVSTDDGAPESQMVLTILLPLVQETRSYARFLTCRAMLSLGEGDPKAALDDLYLVHRLGHHVASGSVTLIETLVGIAIDSIASSADQQVVEHATLSSKDWLAYRDRLHGLPEMRSMADVIMMGERFMFLDTVFFLEKHGVAGLSMIDGDAAEGTALGRWLSAAVIDFDMLMEYSHPWYQELYRIGNIEDARKREVAWDVMDEKLKRVRASVTEVTAGSVLRRLASPRATSTKTLGGVLVSLLLPAVRQATRAEDRLRAYHVLSDIGLGLAAFKADNGSYPKSLSELKPKYIAEIPSDPRSDTPPTYERTADGFRLYCVGDNMKDDGGKNWNDRDESGEFFDDPRFVVPVPEEK